MAEATTRRIKVGFITVSPFAGGLSVKYDEAEGTRHYVRVKVISRLVKLQRLLLKSCVSAIVLRSIIKPGGPVFPQIASNVTQ
jgi:hypothetical protein